MSDTGPSVDRYGYIVESVFHILAGSKTGPYPHSAHGHQKAIDESRVCLLVAYMVTAFMVAVGATGADSEMGMLAPTP